MASGPSAMWCRAKRETEVQLGRSDDEHLSTWIQRAAEKTTLAVDASRPSVRCKLIEPFCVHTCCSMLSILCAGIRRLSDGLMSNQCRMGVAHVLPRCVLRCNVLPSEGRGKQTTCERESPTLDVYGRESIPQAWRDEVSNLGFGYISVPPEWRDDPGLAMLLAGLLRPETCNVLCVLPSNT